LAIFAAIRRASSFVGSFAGRAIWLHRKSSNGFLGNHSKTALLMMRRKRTWTRRNAWRHLSELATAAPFKNTLETAELREAGPVVWLERYGLWACVDIRKLLAVVIAHEVARGHVAM
jgi:hypothetical protein